MMLHARDFYASLHGPWQGIILLAWPCAPPGRLACAMSLDSTFYYLPPLVLESMTALVPVGASEAVRRGWRSACLLIAVMADTSRVHLAGLEQFRRWECEARRRPRHLSLSLDLSRSLS